MEPWSIISVTFEQFSFCPAINSAIQTAGFSHPTPVQQQIIPLALQGRDLLGMAQTGTGKTAAFVLPILQKLSQDDARHIRALIIAPTRELAEQIHQVVSELGKGSGVRSLSIYGGVSKRSQLLALRQGVQIVVGCPGRLLDHIGQEDIDLSAVEMLVLDEADRLCDMGFLPDIRRIIGHLPARRQTMFFSATMPADIRKLAGKILSDPVHVQVGAAAPVASVSHSLFPVSEKLKHNLLLTVLQQTPAGRVLAFTRTKRRAQNLATHLGRSGYRVSALQGDMTQNRRHEAIEGFRKGKYDILIATDVAARGIDVTEISHVINFDMPDTPESYTHRIGRTGRAHHRGEAFTFTTEVDEKIVRQIEKVLGSPITRRVLPGFAPVASDATQKYQAPLRVQPGRRRFRLSASGRKLRLRAVEQERRVHNGK
jgi:ATP-dependent RNA helicase RhlE